jgi:hypothetical protein
LGEAAFRTAVALWAEVLEVVMNRRRVFEVACVVAISIFAASQLLSAQTPGKRPHTTPQSTSGMTAEQQKQLREQKRQEAEQKRKQAEADRKAREELIQETQPKTLEFTDYNFRYTTVNGWKVNEGSPSQNVASALTFVLPAPPTQTKEGTAAQPPGPAKFDVSVVPLAEGQTLDGFTAALVAQLEIADRVKFETPVSMKLATIDAKTLNARSLAKEPDPARERIIVAVRDGKVYVLRLHGPAQSFARVSAGADRMVKSFIWLDMPDSTTRPSPVSAPLATTKPTTRPAE